MSLPKAHLSEKAVGINLCCVTDKDKKNGQVLLGKENKLVKEQRWKKTFWPCNMEKRQSLVKGERAAGEAIFEPSKLKEKN